MTYEWGILGPGGINSTQRTRTLGLAKSVRWFNEQAVPGLGGVWYGRQLFLATLGVWVAEKAKEKGSDAKPVIVTNAIEALACWLALNPPKNCDGAQADGRVRGKEKLQGVTDGQLSFKEVSKPGFYVSQPMRMATVSALPALGLVKATGSRFNSFSSTDSGKALVKAVLNGNRPNNQDVVTQLEKWVGGEKLTISDKLCKALSPMKPLPEDARKLVKAALCQGQGNKRRENALQWVSKSGNGATGWDTKPNVIDQDHWNDLKAGAYFFMTRDAAIALLDQVEGIVGQKGDRTISLKDERLSELVLNNLKEKANAFCELSYEKNADAKAFCDEVKQACDQSSNDEILRKLIARDGRILRLNGNDQICAGPAFRGRQQTNAPDPDENEESPQTGAPNWPEGISHRIRNLWWLSQDLEGKLDESLNPHPSETANG